MLFQAIVVVGFSLLGIFYSALDFKNDGWLLFVCPFMGLLMAWGFTQTGYWLAELAVIIWMYLLKPLFKFIFKVWSRRYCSLEVSKVRLDPLTGELW